MDEPSNYPDQARDIGPDPRSHDPRHKLVYRSHDQLHRSYHQVHRSHDPRFDYGHQDDKVKYKQGNHGTHSKIYGHGSRGSVNNNAIDIRVSNQPGHGNLARHKDSSEKHHHHQHDNYQSGVVYQAGVVDETRGVYQPGTSYVDPHQPRDLYQSHRYKQRPGAYMTPHITAPGEIPQQTLTRTTSSSGAILSSATMGRSPRLDRQVSGSFNTLSHRPSHHSNNQHGKHQQHRNHPHPSNNNQPDTINHNQGNFTKRFWPGVGIHKWIKRKTGTPPSSLPETPVNTLPPSGSQVISGARSAQCDTLSPGGAVNMTTEVLNVSKYTIPGTYLIIITGVLVVFSNYNWYMYIIFLVYCSYELWHFFNIFVNCQSTYRTS